MSDGNTWLFPVLVFLGVVAAAALQFTAKSKAARVVRGRPLLSDEDFEHRFFPDDQCGSAAKVRQLLKPYIPVNYQLVYPEDELVRDLQLATSDGLDANSFIADLESAFEVSIDDTESTKWRSLRDVVEGVQRIRELKFGKHPVGIAR